MQTRTLSHVIAAVPTSDGAGVRLRRSIGARQTQRLDPFLMLDEFSSDDADDYIGGFPAHPHRGFETVTYMLDGHMRHEDHLGNTGDLVPGAVQWMTAGRGIVHSEMPQQSQGRMRGFQLWINLPAREKMQPAAYRDIAPALIPTVSQVDGTRIKVVAGTYVDGATSIDGPINPSTHRTSTDPSYLDVALAPTARFEHAVYPEYSAFVYVYEGTLVVGDEDGAATLRTHEAGVLSAGARIVLRAGREGARALVLAGRPLREPIVQYGPVVMNTREEIEQAIADYQSGAFTRAA
ncbi:MAG TPA: pirin family protein [Candidatus Saccharimonadia bacterium]|nr:pirin family protein [Candidatus Saccharimonadia bacterium]